MEALDFSSNDMHPHSFEIIKSIEKKAEELLTDRYSLVELDKKRQKAREAIRAVKEQNNEKKQWLCIGTTFVQFSKETALDILKQDYQKVDEEIEQTRQSMKLKYSELCDLERRDEVTGFQLNPLSRDDRHILKTQLES